jgi:hypothetical protein
MRAIITLTAFVVGILGMGASTAFAAKGVKKNVEALHTVHGVVTKVEHKKNKEAGGHIGEITVKVQQHKKKGQPAAAGAKQEEKTVKFSVNKETKFALVRGKQRVPAQFAAVREGEHVAILAKGEKAEAVGIHVATAKSGGAKPNKKKVV